MYPLLSVAPGTIGDIIVLVIILAFAVVACAKGFISTIIGFVGTFLSVLLSFIFCRTMALNLQNWFGLLDKLSLALTDAFSKIPILNVDISSNVETGLTDASIPAFMIRMLMKIFTEGTEVAAGTTAAQLIAPFIANIILLVISFLIIFIVIKVLCFILNKTLGEMTKQIPIVKSVNAVLGFAVGTIEGFFVIYMTLFLLSALQIPSITEFIYSTTIIKALYENNILGVLIRWITSSEWLIDYMKEIIKF